MGKKAVLFSAELACLLVAMLLGLVARVSAADEVERLCPFSTGQRMPTSQVRQVYEDREGTMWIATFRGLVRYADGKLRVYRSNLFTPELLPCNNVISVCEDFRQRLWIGTESGLCRLDKNTGRVVRMELGKERELRVNELLVTHDGNVYAGLIRGLMRYDEATRQMVGVGLDDVNIQSLAEMPNGDILIGSWGKGLFTYSPSRGFKPVALPSAIASKTILALHYDRLKRLWIGTLNEGLCQLAADGNGLWQIATQHAGGDMPSNCVYSIAEKDGQLFAGTRKGLFVEGRKPLLAGDEVLGVCVDGAGDLWAATKGFGLYTTSAAGKSQKEEDVPHYQVLTDKENGKWEPRNYGVEYRSAQSSQPVMLLPTLRPYRLSLLSNGRVAIPMHDAGLYIAYKGKIERHLSRRGGDMFIPHDLVHHAIEDSRGNLWVATRLGIGIRTYDGQDRVLSDMPNAPKCLGEEIYFLAEDREGTVWAATADGMIRCDSTFHRYSLDNGNFPIGNPTSFCHDKAGRRWVGTDGMGLCIYNIAKDCFVSVHEQLQLPGDIVTDLSVAADSSLLVNVGSEVISLSGSELESMHRNVRTDEPQAYWWIACAVAAILVCSAAFVLYRRQRVKSIVLTVPPSAQSAPIAVEMADQQREFVDKATAVVMAHLSDCDFDVPQLANELSTSRTTLHRRMKEMTGKTTSAFIRDIRMNEACRILSASNSIRVSELAYSVGFNDPKYFSRCFKEMFGVLPGDYAQGNNVAK